MPRKSKARPFITLDAETDPFKVGRIPRPFIWGCYHGEESAYYEFEREAELVEHLRGQRVIAYAHNGGRFDFHYLRQYADSERPIMVINGRLASFYIGQCELRDSMNILVNPLRAFSKEDIDYAKLEPDVRHLHMPEIRAYLRSDCVNLYNTIERYFGDYGRSMTQAGAAMRYWKKKYKFPFVPQDATQAMRYRDFYYGGRVQCFVTGHRRRKFKVIDINSAYPRAMKEKHPIAPTTAAQKHLPKAGAWGRALVRFEGVSRGALPWKDETGRLHFPDDGKVREYSCTGWELETALELNRARIDTVREVRLFKQTVCFADYVDEFWSKRIDAKAIGDQAGDVFAKLFLNSLYGKWAADPEKYREYLLCSPDSFGRWRAGGYSPVVNWQDRILMERPLPEEKHRYYNVACAASITGWVRAYLLRGLHQCSGLLYCDTDSIAACDIGSLPLGPELGQWKLEAECTEYAIAAKKTYAFKYREPVKGQEWKVASKGVKLTPEEIIRVAEGEAITHAPSVPTYSVSSYEPEFTKRVIRRTEAGLYIG